jgi:hypothetical protein
MVGGMKWVAGTGRHCLIFLEIQQTAVLYMLADGQFVRKLLTLERAGKSYKIFRCFLMDIESCERLR